MLRNTVSPGRSASVSQVMPQELTDLCRSGACHRTTWLTVWLSSLCLLRTALHQDPDFLCAGEGY